MIDLAPKHLEEVRSLLSQHVPEYEVRVFGSRINGTAKSYSDLDIVLVGPTKIEQSRLNRLEEAFEYSELPFRVEVLDWHAISDSFRQVINNSYEVL